MIDINWNPSRKDLRVFGLAFLGFSWVASGLLWWRFGWNDFIPSLWIAGPIVGLVGLLWPRALRFLFIALTLLAFPIGLVIGNVLMAFVYYLLVTPIGLVFKLVGRDSLHRKLDPQATTHWVARKPPASMARYFRQY